MRDLRHVTTERLRLDAPMMADLSELHAIYADPRMGADDPAREHTEDMTRTMLTGWIERWETEGLGPWIIRSRDHDAVLGNAGCWLRPAGYWNLGYGISPDHHGRGLAPEAARPALGAAIGADPDVPLVARIPEQNAPSIRVAEKLGLTLQRRGTDPGAPGAALLIYADRQLTDAQRTAAARHVYSSMHRVRLGVSTDELLDELRAER